MSLTTAQQWLRTITWLRRNFPAQYIVSVRSKPLKEDSGYTEYIKESFYIIVKRKQSFLSRMDTLIHEWAHCLTWLGSETHEDHSAEWGIAYARIYRTFIEWNYGQKKREEEE